MNKKNKMVVYLDNNWEVAIWQLNIVMPSLFIAPTHAPAFTKVLHKLPLPFMYANSNAVGIDITY